MNQQKIQNCLSLKMLAEASQEIWNDYDPGKGYTEEQCMKPLARLAHDMLVLGGYFEEEAEDAGQKLVLGTVFPELQSRNLLMKYLKREYETVPCLDLDMKGPFHLYLQADEAGRPSAESFLWRVLYESLNQFPRGDFQWICVDVWRGGKSFGPMGRIAWSNSELFGKGIYTGDKEMTMALEELEKRTREILEKLAGGYASVYEYNKEHKKPIPLTLAVFCDVSMGKAYEIETRLKWIQENSGVTGIHLILLETRGLEEAEYIGTEDRIHLVFQGESCRVFAGGNSLSLGMEHSFVTEEKAGALLEKLGQVQEVDTSIEAHEKKSGPFFSMDSTEMLRIPFAFDDEENLCYLELGGSAPAHGLLSGTTGSGKSVTLHTILGQIMMNYHPDDVEIWAIDYKAVEFSMYVKKKTPHIRVIGQDNSVDFSIGLLELASQEYERRKQLFVQEVVRDFNAYRKKYGPRSLPRIFIMIDEFHNLTQAVQNYSGEKNYKTVLENLLRETRAMGMTFFFCSQTIAAGLEGLSEAGRSQIGCRLCMLQDKSTEIRETLALAGNMDFDWSVVTRLKAGELYYKRPKASCEDGGPGYSLDKYHVIYISEEKSAQIIDQVNEALGEDYKKKDDIIARGSGRYPVSEKPLHTISRFIRGENVQKTEGPVYFFGAPRTLEHEFRVELGDDAGSNVLLVGENDDLRESSVVQSVLGLLKDPENQVYVSILERENEDQRRLYDHLRKIRSDRLHLAFGLRPVLEIIEGVKKMKPLRGERRIYFWYGLNKLKNAFFLLSQEDGEDEDTVEAAPAAESWPDASDPLSALDALLNQMNGGEEKKREESKKAVSGDLDVAACRKILQNLAEYGPENGYYNFSIYNQVKAWKKGNIEKLSEYEHRIGLRMSNDSSYELFGSAGFVNAVDEESAIYYNGSSRGRLLRPYTLPTDAWIGRFNKRLEGGE